MVLWYFKHARYIHIHELHIIGYWAVFPPGSLQNKKNILDNELFQLIAAFMEPEA